MNRTEHLLVILGEECSEVAERASKALRFGLLEMEPGQNFDNTARLVGEIWDLRAAIEMLDEDGIIAVPWGPEGRSRIEAKKRKVEKMLLYSRECGTLESEVLSKADMMEGHVPPRPAHFIAPAPVLPPNAPSEVGDGAKEYLELLRAAAEVDAGRGAPQSLVRLRKALAQCSLAPFKPRRAQ